MENQIPYELIAKHLAGETAEHEDLQLWAWIELHEDHLRQFQQLVEAYAQNPLAKETWLKQSDDVKVEIQSFSKHQYFSVWKLAASIVLLLGLTYFFIPDKDETYIVIKTDAGELKECILPDSSRIWLNGASSISYSDVNFKRNRQIKLEGEAFFKIKNQPDNPFLIEFDSVILITNSGEYNIQSYLGIEERNVIVSDGVANFIDLRKEMPDIQATTGHKLVSLMGYGILSLEINTDINYDSWRTRNYIFDQIPASAIAEMISKNQGVQLAIPDKELGYQKIQGLFEDYSSQQLIHFLMLELDARLEIRNGHNYLIKNKKS